uniref:Uncharacterized protein n=1 Tax=Odontella aurita TaxID=265563 RepID=A0A7S4KAR1_9STRA|mmetsp:Transcript_8241/g.24743  ORF Transcript_8241/g.24743 Transcript_8241/m.24743 type:complete len:304 (+) Transcript_8241:183-1094(+)
MDRFYSGPVSRDWSGSSSSSGAELTENHMGGQLSDSDCVGGRPFHVPGCAPPSSGTVTSRASKRSSGEAGFQHSGGGIANDHSAGLRSFKRLRIDGTRASMGAATSTTASLSSTCGSVSPPLPPVSSLARAAVKHAARPFPDRMYQHQQGSGDGAPAPPPHPSEVTFRSLTSDEWGCPAVELPRSVSTDSQHQAHQHRSEDSRGYEGMNHMLGDLHILRQRRMERTRQRQENMQASDLGDGRHVNGIHRGRVIPRPLPSNYHQQLQPQQELNQQQQQQQQEQLPPPPPRWRRSVHLPTSSQLY